MSAEAIIIAVNQNYEDNGNITKHIEHAKNNDKVFWHLVPPGDRDISWAHPDIIKGYFFISGTNKIKYSFTIENVRKISEYKTANLESKVKDYIPKSRQERWDDNANRYAVLIKNIIKLEHEIPLNGFELVSTHRSVKRIMNYVIVFDKPNIEGVKA
jgi:hypothetical protein